MVRAILRWACEWRGVCGTRADGGAWRRVKHARASTFGRSAKQHFELSQHPHLAFAPQPNAHSPLLFAGEGMSFLPSFTALGASASTASSSSTGPTFKPASLSYFTIFCPALKPPKSRRSQQEDEEEQDAEAREEERESAQILFYTSRARAAPKDRMLRQIGVAKGMIEFCSMVHPTPSDTAERGRTWNVHSSKRRMILVEVEAGVWVHASIDLACTTTSSTMPSRSASFTMICFQMLGWKKAFADRGPTGRSSMVDLPISSVRKREGWAGTVVGKVLFRLGLELGSGSCNECRVNQAA